MLNIENFVLDNDLGKLILNTSLKNYNTYKVEATAKYIFYPYNVENLIKMLEYIKENNISYKILGKGSNLIFNFDVYEGILIKLDELNQVTIEDDTITVESGYPLIKLAMEVSNLGLTGLEFATGIPGTIGGAVYMNAGAYKSDMSNVIEDVTYLTPELEIKTVKNEELNFGYRTSIFKENKDNVILKTTLKLSKGDKEEILKLIQERATKRKESQPLEYPSAGSVFRNPEGDFAGRLIEKQGFKGKNINGAEVSTKHANFIINTDNCSGKDIVELINEIKETIKKEYDIDLILEQEIIEK